MDFKLYYNDNDNKASIIAGFPQSHIDEYIKNENTHPDDNKIVDIVFVIDISSSMDDRFYDSIGTITIKSLHNNQQSKNAVVIASLMHTINYLKILSKNNHKIRLSIISFNENSFLLLDKVLVEDSLVFDNIFTNIRKELYPWGGTNIYKALQFTKNHIDTILSTNTDINNINIFVMTDGYNNNKNDNISMVEFFRSVPYYDRFVGFGIGNATDYDAELLDRLFKTLKGSPSASELTDNITSGAFGACSTVLTNFNIVFENIGNSEFYSPLHFEKKDDTITVKLDRVDFSQKFIFSFDNKDELTKNTPLTPIKMKVSYKTNIKNKTQDIENNQNNQEVYFEILLNTGENNDINNDRINALTHYIHDFIKITNSSLTQKENQEQTQELISKFFSWPKEDRTGDIGNIWSANENIVINHKLELDKYVDLLSYSAYTKICSKQLTRTVTEGRTPSLARQATEDINTRYSSDINILHNNNNNNNLTLQIPENINMDDLGCPPPLMFSRQFTSSCTSPYNSPVARNVNNHFDLTKSATLDNILNNYVPNNNLNL